MRHMIWRKGSLYWVTLTGETCKSSSCGNSPRQQELKANSTKQSLSPRPPDIWAIARKWPIFKIVKKVPNRQAQSLTKSNQSLTSLLNVWPPWRLQSVEWTTNLKCYSVLLWIFVLDILIFNPIYADE